MAAQLGGGPGRGNLGSSHLLEARLDTQTLDLAPAAQEPLLDPASLDLEASTLSRSFHRPKGNPRVEEGVLVSIEAEAPCEASKLSQVLHVWICLLMYCFVINYTNCNSHRFRFECSSPLALPKGAPQL